MISQRTGGLQKLLAKIAKEAPEEWRKETEGVLDLIITTNEEEFKDLDLREAITTLKKVEANEKIKEIENAFFTKEVIRPAVILARQWGIGSEAGVYLVVHMTSFNGIRYASDTLEQQQKTIKRDYGGEEPKDSKVWMEAFESATGWYAEQTLDRTGIWRLDEEMPIKEKEPEAIPTPKKNPYTLKYNPGLSPGLWTFANEATDNPIMRQVLDLALAGLQAQHPPAPIEPTDPPLTGPLDP